MIEAIVTGLFTGLVLAVLTGPVFFALIKISVERGFISGMSFAMGVFASDIVYIVLTFFSTSFIAFETQYKDYITVLGSIFLLVIGLNYVLRKVVINYEPTKIITNTGYFLKGFTMCMLNPLILFYWITIATVTVGGKYSTFGMIVFFTSTLLTLFGMDVIKAYYASKFRSKIKEIYLTWLNRVAGAVIICVAIQKLVALFFFS